MTTTTETNGAGDARSHFIKKSVWHGGLDEARAVLAEHPELAAADIHVAAVLGDDLAVRRFLADRPALARQKSAPLGWDPLTHLCFSRFLRLEPERSDAFVRAAAALLDAGASPNAGFFDVSHRPNPEWEPVLYGAAGVAHHAELTQLLLEHGANPTDIEVVYHSPETYDNRALLHLLDSGRLGAEELALMLLRKVDWHDHEGVRLLLERGADPNRPWNGRRGALHHALLRDNAIETITLLLDHGADPLLDEAGESAIARAARRGRGDVLALLERRDVAVYAELQGPQRLLAALARGDAMAVRRETAPDRIAHVLAHGGTLLGDFALTDNAAGLALLLDLGVPVDAPYPGDGYWGIPTGGGALHVAAWLLREDVVRVLLARGAAVDARDAIGRTPLALALRASVDSYWSGRRSPQLVDALLRAGAAAHDVPFPTGDAGIDEVLRAHGR